MRSLRIDSRTTEGSEVLRKLSGEVIKGPVESLGREMPDEPFPTRNEKISADGETATLEVKDTTHGNRWVRLHFVKGDDGAWKLTFPEDQIGQLVPGELVP